MTAKTRACYEQHRGACHCPAAPRIVLYLAPCGTWYADISAGTRRQDGQTQIPTPFSRGAHWETVRDDIAARNPDHEVLVDILSRR